MTSLRLETCIAWQREYLGGTVIGSRGVLRWVVHGKMLLVIVEPTLDGDCPSSCSSHGITSHALVYWAKALGCDVAEVLAAYQGIPFDQVNNADEVRKNWGSE